MGTGRQWWYGVVLALLMMVAQRAPAVDWTFEDLPLAGRPYYAMLGLERARDGTLYVAVAPTSGTIVVYRRTPDGWQELPTLAGGAPFQLAIDSRGTPYVLSVRDDNGTRRLELSRLSSGTWQTSLITTHTWSIYAALCIDPQDCPHIAYQTQFFEYIRWTGQAWTSPVRVNYDAALSILLALDSHQMPHIVYQDPFDNLQHCQSNGTGFVKRTIGSYRPRSMAFDSQDRLFLCVESPGLTTAMCYFNGTSWYTLNSGGPGMIVHRATFGLDMLEEAYMVGRMARYDSYTRAWSHSLGYAWAGWIGWIGPSVILNYTPMSGPEAHAVRFDPRNRMHLAFVDNLGKLRYAYGDFGRRRYCGSNCDVQADSTDGKTFVLSDGATTINTQQIPAAQIYRRGVLEFNLYGIPQTLRIRRAEIRLYINSFTAGSAGFPLLSFFGYSGNGTAEPADALQTAPSQLLGTGEVTVTGLQTFQLDGAMVESLRLATNYLGLVLFDADRGQQVSFRAIGDPSGYSAMLTVEYARPADFDSDGYIDVIDLLTLMDSWAKAAGEPGYDPACDINRDDTVDVADLLSLVADFGS